MQAGFDIGIHNGDMKYNAKWEVIVLTYPYRLIAMQAEPTSK
jgi:hypothetical protein